jgi:ketosteroid isomerase-like protein
MANDSTTMELCSFYGGFGTFSCITEGDEMRVKTHTVIFMLITSLLGLIGCQELGDKDAARVKAEIEASVNQASKDWEEFPKSLDRPRLLKHYAADYSGMTDGARETLKDLEKWLDDLAEEIKLGTAIGISDKVTELNIQPFTGRLALLTYQDETKVGQGGVLRSDIKANCSTLVRKEGETWLVFHEHCSTMRGMTNLAQLQQTLGCSVVGNTRSAIYHMSGGQFYDQMQFSPDAICFKSEEDARGHGYRPSQR